MHWCMNNFRGIMSTLPTTHLSILLNFWPPRLKISFETFKIISQGTLWDIQISHKSLHDECHTREDENLKPPGIQKRFKKLFQTLDSFSTLLNSPRCSSFTSGKPCVKLAALLSRKNPSIDIYEDESNICGCSKKEFSNNVSLFASEILFHWKEQFLHTRSYDHVQ